jgi:hypothetical protein
MGAKPARRLPITLLRVFNSTLAVDAAARMPANQVCQPRRGLVTSDHSRRFLRSGMTARAAHHTGPGAAVGQPSRCRQTVPVVLCKDSEQSPDVRVMASFGPRSGHFGHIPIDTKASEWVGVLVLASSENS